MKTTQAFLFLLGLTWWGPSPLKAQPTDAIAPVLLHLQPNIFAIRSNFADETAELGFGFLIGATADRLYGVTASHVVRHSTNRAIQAEIQARFAATFDWQSLRVVRDWELEDLALVELARPRNFQWQPRCVDPSTKVPTTIRFLGSWQEGEPQWIDLGLDGKVFANDGTTARFSLPTILPGSSGAPLISAQGVVGMAIKTSGTVGTALAIGTIARLVGQGQTQYFSLSPYAPASTPTDPTPGTTRRFQPTLVKIAGGSFTRGCTAEQGRDCQEDEKPTQRVSLSPFYLGTKEVTVAEFQEFVQATNYRTDAAKENSSFFWNGQAWTKRPGINWTYGADGQPLAPQDYPIYPVVHISWNDAQAYCRWLSQETGEDYRLPTEAEWEYAARAGGNLGTKYSGSDNVEEVAWHAANAGGALHPVGMKEPNALGLYDLSGNVFEWCADGYAPYSATPVTNPRGPVGSQSLATRGGSWLNIAAECRVSYRHGEQPTFRAPHLGFRVAKSAQ